MMTSLASTSLGVVVVVNQWQGGAVAPVEMFVLLYAVIIQSVVVSEWEATTCAHKWAACREGISPPVATIGGLTPIHLHSAISIHGVNSCTHWPKLCQLI